MKRIFLALSGIALLSLGLEAGAQQTPAPTSTPAPIPAGPTAHLVKDLQAVGIAWCKRIMLDEYNRTPGATPNVAKFVQDAIDDFHGIKPDPAKLKADAQALLESGEKDPLFLNLAAGVLGNSPPELNTRALAALENSRYNPFIGYITAARVNARLAAQKAPQADQEAQFRITLDYLRAALRTELLHANEFVVLAYWLDSGVGDLLFKRCGAEVCYILQTSPGIPAWGVDYFEGKRHLNEAWKARGDGPNDKVTPEGWQGFRDHLAQARVHFVDSWKAEPTAPLAATQMILVAMGEEGQIDSQRLWFDRAVAAQMDYMLTYANMRWSLRPRFGGSIEAMLSFGEECMRTGRYDTTVPYEYVLAVQDASTELFDRGAISASRRSTRSYWRS